MIKINLLPVKRRKKAKPVPGFLVGLVLLLIVTGIAMYLANSYFTAQVEDLEGQKQANAEKIKQLNETIKEVKDFEALNKKFTERKEIIERLTVTQSFPARLMDEMSQRLTDGIWLLSMSVDREKVDISGVGFTTSDIVTYVQSLKGSEMFEDVKLHETSASKSGDVDTFNFRITIGFKKA
jgi:type IV pilus assembly protein PilN